MTEPLTITLAELRDEEIQVISIILAITKDFDKNKTLRILNYCLDRERTNP